MEHVAKHKFPSVAWDCDVNGDGTETPAMLWSVGMWHRPNIKSVQPVINADGYEESDEETGRLGDSETKKEETQPETNMLKKILAALIEAGIVKDTDSEDTVVGQIGSLIQSLAYQRESKQREAAMAAQMRTALNAVADVAELPDEALAEQTITQLNAVITQRDAQAATIAELNARISTLSAERITSAVAFAIESGRATKADEARLITELNADFDGALSKLSAKPVQLNGKPLNLGGTKPGVMEFQERQARINSEVTKRMEEGRLSYDAAFNAVKTDAAFKPLFDAMEASQAAE
jgi:hypothetical protein